MPTLEAIEQRHVRQPAVEEGIVIRVAASSAPPENAGASFPMFSLELSR
jgi:hypothetical protein